MRCLVTALVLLTAPQLWAQSAPKPPPAAAARAAAPSIPHERYTLPNGLEVILSQDRSTPVVAINLWYHVGAFHEQPGRSGFAHLFEHMMFQGSAHVADDQHLGMLEKLGATDISGSTDYDLTDYYQTVPSNLLETALWLESDRMGFLLPAMTPEKLRTQKEVVKNERRQSTESQPYGLADERFWQALFPAPHPYHGFVIGTLADVEAATEEDVADFFNTWYRPSNATLAVVGDFEREEAKALIEKYFGPLPSGPRPMVPTIAEVQLTAPVTIDLEESVATLPKLVIGWHAPSFYADGDATTDVLARILAEGRASRLYKRMVFEKQLALTVKASKEATGHQGVFTIEAIARPGVTLSQLQTEIDAALDDIREKGVSDAEVRRVRNLLQTDSVRKLQSVGGNAGRASLLQRYNHYLGDPDRFAWDLARYDAVTPLAVQQVVQRLGDNRVILRATPKPPEKTAPTASAASTEVR